jgi:hypothetical protein
MDDPLRGQCVVTLWDAMVGDRLAPVRFFDLACRRRQKATSNLPK